MFSAERVVIPECWEDDVLPDVLDSEGPDALRTSETTDEVAPDPIDGAVAAGQSAPPPPEDMGGVDTPPDEAPQRILRIKKKQKPGFVPPASASAAPTDGDLMKTVRRRSWTSAPRMHGTAAAPETHVDSPAR